MGLKTKLAYIKANFLQQRFHGNALFGGAITVFSAAMIDSTAKPAGQKYFVLFLIATIVCLVIAGLRNASQGDGAETAFKSNCEEISTALGGITAYVAIVPVWLLFTLKAWNVPMLVVAVVAFAVAFQIWGGIPALKAVIKKLLGGKK